MKKLILLLFLIVNFNVKAFPIPKDNIATFDILRKNKVIGSIETTFNENDKNLIIKNIVNIKIKILFFPAYKFYQETKEIWRDGEFVKFEGYTDFEDEREYFIQGEDLNNDFIAFGMDGKITTEKNILPLNYWNKKILHEKKIFDTQKGIIREITVKKLKDEDLKIDNTIIKTEKYLLDASTNLKDKGPFPQYTLWYAKNDELVKFKFMNWKDNKEIVTIRSNWKNN